MQIFNIKSSIQFLPLFLIVRAIIFTTTVTCQTTEYRKDFEKDTSGERINYRLKTDIIPLHYDIAILTLLDNMNMLYCNCQIKIRVIEETSGIILHSPYLSESSISLVDTNGTMIEYQYVDYIIDMNVLNIHFETLSPGQYILNITCFYTLPQGKEEVLFQTTMALDGSVQGIIGNYLYLLSNGILTMINIKIGIPFLTLWLSTIIFTATVRCKTTEYGKAKDTSEPRNRLKTDIIPLHYDIAILTLIEDMNMLYCKCQIKIQVIKETSLINLHCPYMTKSSISLVNSNGIAIKYHFVHYITDMNVLSIYFQKLPPGQYVLNITYFYTLPQEKEEALFYTTMALEGKKKVSSLLTTNVHTIEAREWFPCWDEPSYRTTFEFKFFYDGSFYFWPTFNDTTSVVEHGSKIQWKWANFSIVEKIPASSVMFALTNLPLVPHRMGDTMYIRPRMTGHTEFANNVINKIKQTTWFKLIPASKKEIQQIAIPLIKQDIIGKWRLVIYKELLVVYDEKTDSSVKKLEIARTITYGMVHQLLDNEIGLPWWSELWLREGLIFLLHAKILNEIFPEWRFMELFVVQVQQESLRLEQHDFMKPLEYNLESSSDIKSLVSFALYVKAPAIVRMIQYALGSDIEEELKACFLTKQMNNTWEPLETYNPKTVCGVKYNMENWIKKNYYPVVRLKRENNSMLLEITTYNFRNGTYSLQQSTDWEVPVTWTFSQFLKFDNTKSQTLVKTSMHINVTDTEWIIVNKQQIGYYRVLYDKRSIALISQHLQSLHYKRIHVLNRAQIIDDTYHFWREGEYTYGQFKEVVKYLSQEMDYVAWYPMFQIFRDISRFCPFRESESLRVR